MSDDDHRYYVLRTNKALGFFAGDLIELVDSTESPGMDVRVIRKNAIGRAERRVFLHLKNDYLSEYGILPFRWVEDLRATRGP